MMDNNGNLLETLKSEIGSKDEEAFKLKVKALIKSRELLKQQNEELAVKLKEFEQREAAGKSANSIQNMQLANDRLAERLKELEQRESVSTYMQNAQQMQNTQQMQNAQPMQDMQIKSELERMREENERLRYDMERRMAEKDRYSLESMRLKSSLDDMRTENERLLGMATSAGRQPSSWYAPSSDMGNCAPSRERYQYDDRFSFRDRQPTLETNAQMGDMFAKAQIYADKMVADAEKEVKVLKYEAAAIQQSIKDSVGRASDDIRNMRAYISDMTGNLDSQIESIEMMLEECRRKFN